MEISDRAKAIEEGMLETVMPLIKEGMRDKAGDYLINLATVLKKGLEFREFIRYKNGLSLISAIQILGGDLLSPRMPYQASLRDFNYHLGEFKYSLRHNKTYY